MSPRFGRTLWLLSHTPRPCRTIPPVNSATPFLDAPMPISGFASLWVMLCELLALLRRPDAADRLQGLLAETEELLTRALLERAIGQSGRTDLSPDDFEVRLRWRANGGLDFDVRRRATSTADLPSPGRLRGSLWRIPRLAASRHAFERRRGPSAFAAPASSHVRSPLCPHARAPPRARVSPNRSFRAPPAQLARPPAFAPLGEPSHPRPFKGPAAPVRNS